MLKFSFLVLIIGLVFPSQVKALYQDSNNDGELILAKALEHFANEDALFKQGGRITPYEAIYYLEQFRYSSVFKLLDAFPFGPGQTKRNKEAGIKTIILSGHGTGTDGINATITPAKLIINYAPSGLPLSFKFQGRVIDFSWEPTGVFITEKSQGITKTYRFLYRDSDGIAKIIYIVGNTRETFTLNKEGQLAHIDLYYNLNEHRILNFNYQNFSEGGRTQRRLQEIQVNEQMNPRDASTVNTFFDWVSGQPNGISYETNGRHGELSFPTVFSLTKPANQSVKMNLGYYPHTDTILSTITYKFDQFNKFLSLKSDTTRMRDAQYEYSVTYGPNDEVRGVLKNEGYKNLYHFRYETDLDGNFWAVSQPIKFYRFNMPPTPLFDIGFNIRFRKDGEFSRVIWGLSYTIDEIFYFD